VSDHDHDHERGGHEVDKLPNARLFNLLFGLSFLVLLSSIGVIQLFNMQVKGIEQSRAKQVSFRLLEYRDEMSKLQGSHGSITVLDEGGVERPAHHMPVAEARRRVLENPELLGGAPKYRGWENSSVGKTISTLQEANKAARPAVVPQPEEEPGSDEPGSDEPGSDEPANDEPGSDEPAQKAPAQKPTPEAPAEKAPAQKPAPKAPAEKPAPKAPAEKPAPADKPAPKKPAPPTEGDGE
jgi:hypothetical protein